MTGIMPIELPRSTLEVLVDLTLRLVTARPELDPIEVWGRLLEKTFQAPPLISVKGRDIPSLSEHIRAVMGDKRPWEDDSP